MSLEQEHDTGIGTSGTATLRTSIDTAQLTPPGITDPAHSVPVVQAKLQWTSVGASTTAAILGTTGAVGDYLSHVMISPISTTPGAVSLFDGGTSWTIFFASTLPSTIPFPYYVGAASKNGPWKITTGANVFVFAVGVFT